MNHYVYVLLSFVWYSSVKSLTFITENSLDNGRWTFQEGSTVRLVCTNYPYTGIHTFTFDWIGVLFCTGSVCVQNDGYQKEFSFIHDTDSGIFTWIINNVDMTYNDKVFECHDGKKHILTTIAVNMAKGGSSEKPSEVVIAIACVAGFCVIIIGLIIIIYTCIRISAERLTLVIVRKGNNAAAETKSNTLLFEKSSLSFADE